MTKNLLNRILIILGLVLVSVYFNIPLEKKINLGLDLKGGMNLVLHVEVDKLSPDAKSDAVQRAIEILRRRIDGMGVGEPVIQKQGENEILVQLPGVTDRETAIAMIGKVAQLEFRLVESDPAKLKQALDGQVPQGYILKNRADAQEPVLLFDKVALSGETVSNAVVDYDQMGLPYISLTFNAQGSKQFGSITQSNVGERLAIIMDGEVLSAPNITEPILGGQGQITGQFSYEEASQLSLALRSGALPAPMRIEEERTIGPLLGKDSIRDGINAAALGGGLVCLFMCIYYLKAGVVACLALAVNFILLFGFMGFFNVMMPASPLTLTLPGIAGIILTLGMAVDANVLINERIRDELRAGRPMQVAINNGFSRALSAIVDSNITTLLAAFMLFQFGSGPIKGFAVTLSIGLMVSLFTALFVSRTIFNLFLRWRWLKNIKMLQFFGDTKIDFISKRYVCFAISLFLITWGMYAIIQKGEKAFGIDFVGGQIQEYKFSQPVNPDKLREILKSIDLSDAVIQQFDQFPENVIIRTSEDSYTKVNEAFGKSFPEGSFEVLRTERVGPVVGKALRKQAILAITFALAGILIYVAVRFKHFDFALAGVIALLHDILVSLGMIVVMGRQVDLLVISALLTIAGYSINDTIIIYDRVRENLAGKTKYNLAEILNLTVNQTLGRTVITTLATLLTVFVLYLKGGEVLNTFALCLLIGFIAGSYSTIFIASPIVLLWQKITK